MVEYKCDFCDKVINKATRPHGLDRLVAPGWDITVSLDRRCETEHGSAMHDILICDDCIEKIKDTPFSDLDDEKAIIKALLVTKSFDAVHPLPGLAGLPPVIGMPSDPDARDKLKHALLGMVDGLHPDAFEKGVAVVKKFVKLGGKAHVKMFEKLEEFIENKAKKLFGVETDGNDDPEKPESDREDEKA